MTTFIEAKLVDFQDRVSDRPNKFLVLLKRIRGK